MPIISPERPVFPSIPAPGRVSGHWSLTDNPHLLRALEYSFIPPEGVHDLLGDWRLSYDLVFCGPQNFQKIEWLYQGWVVISRNANKDGTFDLSSIEQHVLGPDPALEWQRIETRLSLNTDSLATIPDNRPWTIRTHTLGQTDPDARPFSTTGERSLITTVEGRRIWKRSVGTTLTWQTELPGNLPITSSPGLMEACSRMVPDSALAPEFGILRQGTSWCPGQTLKALAGAPLTVGGCHLHLHGFVQTGTGHLPTFFWYDEPGRLVAMRQGILALVHNPDPVMKARCPHEA